MSGNDRRAREGAHSSAAIHDATDQEAVIGVSPDADAAQYGTISQSVAPPPSNANAAPVAAMDLMELNSWDDFHEHLNIYM